MSLLTILLLQLHMKMYRYEVSYQHQQNFLSADCGAAAALWYIFVIEENYVNVV